MGNQPAKPQTGGSKKPKQREKGKFKWPERFDDYHPTFNNDKSEGKKKNVGTASKNKRKKEKNEATGAPVPVPEKEKEKPKDKEVEKDPNERSAKTHAHKYMNQILDNGIIHLLKEFEELKSYTPDDISSEVFCKYPLCNRYHDVPCLDATRIELAPTAANKDGYIHANYVRLYPNEPPRYICAQGPMDKTIVDFWEMVIQTKTNCVVMLCQFIELNKPKCAAYYPIKPNTSQTYTVGTHKVTVTNTGKVNETELEVPPATAIHTMTITSGTNTHKITHLQWGGWPDHTAPNTTDAVYQLIALNKKYSQNVPSVIHCSAGIGRTGTFVAMEFIDEFFKTYDGNFKLPDLVRHLRNQRFMSVQTPSQYVYLHIALVDVVIKHEKLPETNRMKKFRKSFVAYQDTIIKAQMKQPKKPGSKGKSPGFIGKIFRRKQKDKAKDDKKDEKESDSKKSGESLTDKSEEETKEKPTKTGAESEDQPVKPLAQKPGPSPKTPDTPTPQANKTPEKK